VDIHEAISGVGVGGAVNAEVPDDTLRQRRMYLRVCCARVVDLGLLAAVIAMAIAVVINVVITVVVAVGIAEAIAEATDNTGGRQHDSTIVTAVRVVGGAGARADGRVVEGTERHPARDIRIAEHWRLLAFVVSDHCGGRGVRRLVTELALTP